MEDVHAHAGGRAQDGDAMMLGWRKAEGICKVQIEGDDAALIGSTTRCDLLIRGGAKALFRDRAYIMPGRYKQLAAPQAEIFIKLQFHATGSRATATKRSCDMAEP